MIYKLFDDSSKYASFHLDVEDVLDLMDSKIDEHTVMQFSQRNLKMAPYWKPLNISLRQNQGSKNEMPDVSLWRGASMILSDRALGILNTLLQPLGEILPVVFQGKEYALFNCLAEVDPDKELSVRIEEGGYFMEVQKLVFPSGIAAPVFKCPFENNRNLFCSDEFQSVVAEHGLGGIYLGEDLVDFM